MQTTFLEEEKRCEDSFINNTIDLLKLTKNIVIYAKQKGYENIFNPIYLAIVINTVENKYSKNGNVKDKENYAYGAITDFINKTYGCWSKIKERDEEFIIEHSDDLFSELKNANEEYFNQLKGLLKAKNENGTFVVEPVSRESVWKYLDVLIMASIRYIHVKRRPILKEGYTEKYFGPKKDEHDNLVFAGISVKKCSEEWAITLPKFI